MESSEAAAVPERGRNKDREEGSKATTRSQSSTKSTLRTKKRTGSQGSRKEKDRSRGSSKDRKLKPEVTPNQVKVGEKKGNRKEKDGIIGRKIKSETIEEKVQQTLEFTPDKGRNKKTGEGTTPERAVVVYDDDEETPETTNTARRIVKRNDSTPKSVKRKESATRSGTSGSPAAKTYTPNDRKRAPRGMNAKRSEIIDNGSLVGPPSTKSTAKGEPEFTLATEYMEEILAVGVGAKDETAGTKQDDKTTEESKAVTAGSEDLVMDDEDKEEDVQVSNRLEQKTSINNPYKKSTTEDDTKKMGVPVTYATITESPQKKIRTHEKKWEEHDNFFEVSFTLFEVSKDPSMEEVRQNLKSILTVILKRAREVHRKTKINTWDSGVDLPTISKVEDIPESPTKLMSYLTPIRRTATIHYGRNNGWRVRLTTQIEREEFLHHWSISKREYNPSEYVTLRDAPLQSQSYHAAGYFINSGDKQLVKQLETQLSEEVGCKIGLSYRPGALDKRSADAFWTTAKEERDKATTYDKNRVFFKYAPFVLQAYTAKRTDAVKAANLFSMKYGVPEADGQYP